MSTLRRELCRIVSALQTYEHYIIESPFPICLYCDRKPILYLWGRKRQLSHRFFRYQVLITKFQKFKIIWTPGSNLVFPDILSRNVTIDENQHHQLQHKKLPRDIEISDEHGQQITYKISHDDTSAEKVTISIPSSANKATIRSYSDCIMMVKNFLLTALALILPLPL